MLYFAEWFIMLTVQLFYSHRSLGVRGIVVVYTQKSEKYSVILKRPGDKALFESILRFTSRHPHSGLELIYH